MSTPLSLRRTRALVISLTVAALAAAGLVATHADAASTPTYKNPNASPVARAQDLLKQMTTDEKLGQLVQIQVGHLYGDCSGYNPGQLNTMCAADVLGKDHVGSILSGGGDVPGAGYYPNTPQTWATQINLMQKYAIDNSRLHIPILYGADTVHGHNDVAGTTLFPQQIGFGSSWDPTLVQKAQQATSRDAAATGVTWGFSPVADVVTGTRWGRSYESFGEDPVLDGTMAAASVKGLQNQPDVAATVKHFAGYGAANSGLDRTPVDMSLRYFEQYQLPSYEQAIDAGALSVMVDSGSINGIPATGSKYLLTTVLRKQLGFTGVTISDWQDVMALQTRYHVVSDYEHAIALSVNAGMDVTMEPYDADGFTSAIKKAVSDKLIPMSRINQATTDVLAMKFRLGLFDNPYVNANAANRIIGKDADLARTAAQESSVLLRNQNSTLPLSTSSKVVVTGPAADSVADTLGGWSIGWQGVPAGSSEDAVTVLEGMKAADADTSYAPTQSDAVSQLGSADAAVYVAGRGPGAEGPNDVSDPTLPADQQADIAALKATGKPVIVVLIDDRADALGTAASADAILAAWRPGTQGGNGVADLLYGKANPSGRLSVSWPSSANDQPSDYIYNTLPNTYNGTGSVYRPAYPFGFGLSYSPTTEAVSRVKLSGNTAIVRLTVSNTGSRAGDLVVPVYVSQPVSAVLVPTKRLVGFTRVSLAAGQSRSVTVSVPTRVMGVVPGDIDGSGPREVEHGEYVFSTGTVTDAATASRSNTVTL